MEDRPERNLQTADSRPQTADSTHTHNEREKRRGNVRIIKHELYKIENEQTIQQKGKEGM